MNKLTLRSATLAFVGAAALVGLTGCEQTFDTAKLQSGIKAEAVKGFPGHDVKSVECRSSKSIKVEAGATFECKVTVDDTTGRFIVTQTDAKGNVHFEQIEAFLDRPKLEEKISADVSKQVGANTTVTCGKPMVLTYAPKASFNCTGSDGKDEKPIKITVTDVAGNVEWAIE